LDGIPLTIELAAARVGVLSVEQIAERLDDSLRLLSAGGRTVVPRHRTLKATLEWSHELLSEFERELFRRLSVFAGGLTLEAAEEVCSGEGIEQEDILDLLSKLVDKSLVVAEASSPGAGGALRYRMLEPVRQYGWERLEEGEETEWVREQHARHYLALAEAARPKLVGPEEAAWLARLEEEHDNLRATLSWAIRGLEVEIGARLALALWRFWDGRSYLSEGRRWLEAVLTLDGTDGRTERAAPVLPALWRATLLHVAGNLAREQGDYEHAVALYEESLAVRREQGYKKGIGKSFHQLGIVAYERGEYEHAVRLHEQALALFRELEFTDRAHEYGIAIGLSTLADVVRAQGDLGRAATLLEESLTLFRRLGHAWGIARTLTSLGDVACEAGEDARASTLYEEGLELERTSGNKLGTAACLEGLGRVAAARGELKRVARLCGAAAALREEIDAPLPPVARAEHDRTVAAARAALGEDTFATAWAEGWAMTPEWAIEYALSKEEEHNAPTLVSVAEQPPADEPTERLTRREREVALLVRRGLTNRRIALELSISERTVENHVRKILKKLGFSSRARIAAWVAQR
jgi:predicted ATPase/DNA-binding CsgD family transcriptional regulator